MQLPPLHSRSQLLAAGYSDVELRQLVRRGALTPVGRGCYLHGKPPDNPVVRHAIAARAAADRLADGAVFSHATAAVLHGLPRWRIPLDRVHVTRSRRSGSRRGRALLMHSAPLRPEEVTVVAGLPVTSLARTVLDLARTMPFEEAVAVGTRHCIAPSTAGGGSP